MTRVQLEAAWSRVGDVLVRELPATALRDKGHLDDLCRKLVTAAIGHPDGRSARSEASRVAHLPRRARR